MIAFSQDYGGTKCDADYAARTVVHYAVMDLRDDANRFRGDLRNLLNSYRANVFDIRIMTKKEQKAVAKRIAVLLDQIVQQVRQV